MQKRYKVFKKVHESELVSSLYLRLEKNEPLAPFKPGQHLLFKIKPEGQRHYIQRFYSFSEAPGKDYYRISVKKELALDTREKIPSGKASTLLHEVIREGDILEAKGPMGDFFLNSNEQKPIVLIAGGIGITPLLSMVNAIVESKSKQNVIFFFGITNSSDHIFKFHLESLNKENSNIQIFVCYSNPLPSDQLGLDYDYFGFVDIDFIKSKLRHTSFDFYVCGPPMMMDYITASLQLEGISDDSIKTESFGPASVSYSALSDEGSKEKPIVVTFTVSGRTVEWGPEYNSLEELAEAHDIDIDVGCLFGDCGTCLTEIVAGEVSYNHATMIQPDPGTCLPCSCKPKGALKLKI
ncbi:FAD/NAD(P)-binding oxidoreductase [Arenibacter aquaticus]|uniref:nitric oxide dioxygenase n=1 Tax=Arenibacter aquaticus TaxID=2489054 RepID=A0A3S0AF04_9FLAO|nr:2Fe-2S iron-sulfur cluster-binding protein [Arenibacter aquaticus]RTE54084.1 FAD/NAD(P)-binding oxidoreductase [Arenibacter aquaticus]